MRHGESENHKFGDRRLLLFMTQPSMIKTISPVDGSVVVERKCHTDDEITSMLQNATKAFQKNRRNPLSTRIEIANKFLDLLEQNKDALVRPQNGLTDDRVRS